MFPLLALLSERCERATTNAPDCVVFIIVDVVVRHSLLVLLSERCERATTNAPDCVVFIIVDVVVRHSLFPLLALLFERCEQATHAPDCAAVTGLKADIQLFVQHQQQQEGKFSSDDPEVDSLVCGVF